jgi:S1-C subfamily serine protease
VAAGEVHPAAVAAAAEGAVGRIYGFGISDFAVLAAATQTTMRSVLRFLLFVLLTAMALSILYLWTMVHQRGAPADTSPSSNHLLLNTLDREFTSMVAGVLPSVVSIDAVPADAGNPRLKLMRMMLGQTSPSEAPLMGSGVIVSDQGHIVTNLHVVSGAKVEVHLNDGRSLPATFVGADGPSDIAILKIEAKDLRPLSFGDSDKVSVGQMVVAVGNPFGLEETVTQGIISAKGRRAASEAANEFFQTDAAINRGNSGGPLVNMKGEIIGINNSISPQGQGIGFSIPSNTVRRVFENIRDYGHFIRPWFGAYMFSITPELARQFRLPDTNGVLVLGVFSGSPAEIAGVRANDIIVEFNGHPVPDILDLRNRVAELDIGQKVTMKVRRDGREMSLDAVIAAEPGVR